MQNRCETQFKIQKHTFSKINLFVGEKIRKSTQGIEKNQVYISIRCFFFWFEKAEKHGTGDAKGDKKEKKRRQKTI